MRTLDQRYRRNFIVAVVLHVVIVGGVMVVEELPAFGRRADAEPMFVEAALLGELPAGDGTGLGAYKAPEVTPAPLRMPAAAASDESAAPDTRHATPTKVEANDILVPSKKAAPTKKPVAESAKKPATVAKKPAAPAAKSTGGTASAGTSAAEFRKRFASALSSSANGTAGGDNKPAGGGKGKGGNIGSPAGSKNGVAGGIGQGSANWEYFRLVHDVLYEAWEQPDSALDRKLMTTVALRVARDGSIADASVRVGSGNKSMDDSVLSAVRKVPRLEPPPDALVRGSYATITVDFQAEG